MREIGAEVRLAVDKGDPQATLKKLADIARADLAILGDDYIATVRPNPEDDTASVWCEKKWWLRAP